VARTDKDRHREIGREMSGKKKKNNNDRRPERDEDPTTPMAQPHKTNGITRRGRGKTASGILLTLEADQREFRYRAPPLAPRGLKDPSARESMFASANETLEKNKREESAQASLLLAIS